MLLLFQNSSPKILVLTLALLSSITFYAQKEKNKAAPFIRVYDQDGKKISKGRIVSVTDTSLITGPREKPVTIDVSKIGFIKTKRSAGNNILWGTAIGAGTGALLGVSSGDTEGGFFSYSKEEGAAIYGVLMMPIGAAIGAITILFKNSNTYPIDGEPTKWKAFREAMDEQSQLP